MRLPDVPTTPEQWNVIAWAGIAVFVIMGGVGIDFSLNPKQDDADLVLQLRKYSLICWGLAVGTYAVKRLFTLLCS